jgi:hypothetical protein
MLLCARHCNPVGSLLFFHGAVTLWRLATGYSHREKCLAAFLFCYMKRFLGLYRHKGQNTNNLLWLAFKTVP